MGTLFFLYTFFDAKELALSTRHDPLFLCSLKREQALLSVAFTQKVRGKDPSVRGKDPSSA